mmetsp:Transcript_23421/g.39155  ORF Transcript_23421/g.39155 Transcript_23421/m.39155 type:complete len:197 (-) Transcript_23421:207-797(-)|eukprot:CAMPEP_0198205810 /NCGR_PEP_ID=MMETSP1445-20131203/9346_1 /TAXON_ID=36898 /ORGANISM="Pyramimonas sp., Strain CCMP2087" /LENGTH=196 /DNA_ID=CAMNT_0043878255 /DNA_START=239 /DNA_END=829 /DNA_ORIENTATION=-
MSSLTFQDTTFSCKVCGEDCISPAREQKYFAKQGFSPRETCKDCKADSKGQGARPTRPPSKYAATREGTSKAYSTSSTKRIKNPIYGKGHWDNSNWSNGGNAPPTWREGPKPKDWRDTLQNVSWYEKEFFEDISYPCRFCEEAYIFTAGEQAFHAKKGMLSHSTKCKDCKAKFPGTPRDYDLQYIRKTFFPSRVFK